MSVALSKLVRDSVDQRRSGDHAGANAILESVLEECAGALTEGFRAALISALEEASGDPATWGQASAALAEDIGGMDAGDADHRSWLVLCHVLAQHGFLVASGAARDHAVESAIAVVRDARRPPGPAQVFAAIQAALDSGRFDIARVLRPMLGRADECRSVDAFLTFCTKGAAGWGRAGSGVCAAGDEAFRRFVHGHAVAVVGPAPTGLDQGEEIDGFDRIVRINHWGNARLDRRQAGSRTDISYYNFAMGQRICDGERGPFLSEVRFCVFKNPANVWRKTKSRAAFQPDLLYFTGHPNMVPIAVFDLLHFEPARLKLFGTTFFLSRRTHCDSYIGAPRRGRTQLWSLASHDMLSQVDFVRHLADAERLELDPAAAEVIGMGNAEYLAAMEETHGGPEVLADGLSA